MTPFLERQFHLSISGEAFQVTVIIPSSDAHLVGVVSSYEGSGADGPYLVVSEGNNTLGCAARKMGGGALVVRMVSRPAVSAAPIIGAVAGFVPRIFAVTLEAIDVGWKCPLALPKGATRWISWVFYHSSLEAVFPFTIFWVAVGGSLGGMNARDDAARRGLGTSAKEVGDQAHPDCCMRQVALHLVLLLRTDTA